MWTTITLDLLVPPLPAPPRTGLSPTGPCGVTLTVCMVLGPTDTTVAGGWAGRGKDTVPDAPLLLAEEDLGAFMVLTVTTRGPVPCPAATVRVTTVMEPGLVTKSGAAEAWGDVVAAGLPTARPQVLGGPIPMLLLPLLPIPDPLLPSPLTLPPTECVMILAPALPSWRICIAALPGVPPVLGLTCTVW